MRWPSSYSVENSVDKSWIKCGTIVSNIKDKVKQWKMASLLKLIKNFSTNNTYKRYKLVKFAPE